MYFDTKNEAAAEEQGKSRYWWFIVYPDSAPSDWIKRLDYTFVSSAVSPLHEPDPEEGTKKPHYHVMVEFGNTTTYSNVKAIFKDLLNCTIPFRCNYPQHCFEYLTHKNHKHKQQFENEAVLYNGFNTSSFILAEIVSKDTQLLGEVYNEICTFNFTEYHLILKYYYYNDYEKFLYCSKHSILFKAICQSRKYSDPQEVRRINQIIGINPDDELIYDGRDLTEFKKVVDNIQKDLTEQGEE